MVERARTTWAHDWKPQRKQYLRVPNRLAVARVGGTFHGDGKKGNTHMQEAAELELVEVETIAPMSVPDDTLDEGESASRLLDDDRLIADGEAAVKQLNKSTREQILPMARGLAAAKRKYPATQNFKKWLRNSPYSVIGDHDRADLIKIGKQLDEHDDVVVEFLARTKLVSPQLICNELKKELQPSLMDPTCYHSNSADEADTGASDEDEPEPGDAEPDADASAIEESIKSKTSAERRDPWSDDERFDLVLLTPNKRDLKLLLSDYAEQEKTLRRCLPLHQVMVQDVAVIIAAKVSDLPAITDVLTIYGFRRPSRVLLAGRPAGADVTAAEVFIIAERGDIGFSEPEGGWLNGDDPVEIARQLYPDVSSSLLVFGSTEAGGWRCRSWAEMPSVR
jgi:hypothetical protein